MLAISLPTLRPAMPLQAFSFPIPETRLIKAGNFIYKLKIRGGSSYSGEEVMRENCFSQELEEIIRTVLGNLDCLQPFSSAHFNVFPYKRRWEGVSKAMCHHGEENVRAYPFTVILYLEKNTQRGNQAEESLSPQFLSVPEPPSKRCKRDSPLEEAILKDLIKDLEAESEVSVVRQHVDNPHAGKEVEEGPGHVDKRGTNMSDEPLQKPSVSSDGQSQTQGEISTNQDTGEEEGEDEGESAPETAVKPGILTRLASNIFPFSLFFKDP